MSKKIALLVGINYNGTNAQLSGCINDTENMKQVLVSKFGYKNEDITVLSEDNPDKSFHPTASNILNRLGMLIIEAYYHRADEIFFHYSGHGSYMRDTSGDETDQKDEVICPLDYSTAGVITDDLIHNYFSHVPGTCKCICIFDCCHSGSIMDLKYNYKKADTNVVENKNSTISSHIIMLSGCKDDQTSADAYISDKWQGAMTNAFINTMEKFKYTTTCFNLITEMRNYLKHWGYTQIPQISSSIPLTNVSIFSSHRNIVPFLKCETLV